MIPAAFAGAAQAGLAMAGPPSSVYYTWGETTKFTCGPSVAGGEATTALVKDPEGDDVGLGVRTAGGCKCVTTVRFAFVVAFACPPLCLCLLWIVCFLVLCFSSLCVGVTVCSATPAFTSPSEGGLQKIPPPPARYAAALTQYPAHHLAATSGPHGPLRHADGVLQGDLRVGRDEGLRLPHAGVRAVRERPEGHPAGEAQDQGLHPDRGQGGHQGLI